MNVLVALTHVILSLHVKMKELLSNVSVTMDTLDQGLLAIAQVSPLDWPVLYSLTKRIVPEFPFNHIL